MPPLTPDQTVEVLAALLRALPPNETMATTFLGAGAAAAAGLPLASALKDQVVADIWRTSVPEQIRTGHLEDIMEMFQKLANRDGYELVAQHLRPFGSPPGSYSVIADLIARRHVLGVVTTNFDDLAEIALTSRGIEFRILETDSDFSRFDFSLPFVAKLHGSASAPRTMRGSWTDGRQIVSPEKVNFLRQIAQRSNLIFIGYAGEDSDIKTAIREVAAVAKKVFWVDLRPTPSAPVQCLIDTLDSAHNYIGMDAETFLQMIARQLVLPSAAPPDLELALASLGEVARFPSTIAYRSRVQRDVERAAFPGRVRGVLATTQRTALGKLASSTPGADHLGIESNRAFESSVFCAGPYAEELGHVQTEDNGSIYGIGEFLTAGQFKPSLTDTLRLILVPSRIDEGKKTAHVSGLVAFVPVRYDESEPLRQAEVWWASEFYVEVGSEMSLIELGRWTENLASEFYQLIPRFVQTAREAELHRRAT